MLNIGDRVFVANYGAGIIRNIEEKNFTGCNLNYMIIFLLVDDMDLYIPLNNISNYRIRELSNKEVIEESLSILEEEPKKIETNWSKRYRRNSNKINSGNIYKMCEVIRDLYYLKKQEQLPPGEEKILERAENMIVSELMLVYCIDMDAAFSKVRTFGK